MIIVAYTTFRQVFATAATVDVAGYEVWPSAKVRAASFNTLQATLPTTLDSNPAVAFPFNITCNANVADAAAWVDEYDWYLSQRTDNPTKQMLSITRTEAGGAATTYSGKVRVSLTALGIATYTDTGPEALREIFADVTVYCQRRTDDAIDVGKFLDALEADV